MKQLRRIIGLLLAVVMLCSMVPVSFAETTGFADFPTGWSKEAMTAAVNNGLLNGYEDGKIHPEANLTRAQFAAIMVRAFGAKTKTNISAFRDVPVSAWYYEDIAKAVKMGALKGQSTNQMAPDSPITRQEVFTAFARILVLSDDDTSALNKFNDKAEIASWAINHMAALTKRGYVNGDPEGNANPKALISREEFAQLMHNSIRTYITKPGTYTDDLEGITVVRVGSVTLKGLKNTSDLVIGDGAGEGKILIESVDIEKRLLTRGGSIKVLKSTLGEFVVVNNVNGVTKFENYRDEKFFKGIVENTKAQFLKYGGGTTSSPTPPPGGPVTYTLTLYDKDGSVLGTVEITVNPDGTVSVSGNTQVKPANKDYYTFDYWEDEHGRKYYTAEELAAIRDNVHLTPKYKPNEYKVSFIYGDDPDTTDNINISGNAVSWLDNYSAMTSFTVEELTTKELPPKAKVSVPEEYIFDCWTINGIRVDSLTAIKNGGYIPVTATDVPLTIEAHLSLKPTEPVTVTFYKIYSEKPLNKIGDPLTIQKGTAVADNLFPDATQYNHTGYTEDENVASIYKGNEYTHTITPNFWYVKDGVMTPFDASVKVTQNTSVYLLTKALSLMLSYDGLSEPLGTSADYDDGARFVQVKNEETGKLEKGKNPTRVMNSIKDMLAKYGRNQLELALTNNMIPNYDEMVGKVVDKMVDAGVVKLDGNKKNIQVIKIPFKISTFVKEDVANGMIRTYLRDVVKNPDELDKIFTMIDPADFAEQLGIDTIIANMSDADIASLITDENNRTNIIEFIYGDLTQEDSTKSVMMSFVIDYVTTNKDFRDDIINNIIAELKNKDAKSDLKSKALEYIFTQLNTKDKDGNPTAFYIKFVDMIWTDLTSENSVVMGAVTSYVKGVLGASTQDGIDLRKEILTGSLLTDFLKNNVMKEEVIKLLLDDTFINKALDNDSYRESLIEAVMAEETFVEYLLKQPVFHDYIVDQLHPAKASEEDHPLAEDVENLLKNESKFKKYVLDLVKGSSEFVKLFDPKKEDYDDEKIYEAKLAEAKKLKETVENEFVWSDFVENDDDFLKYALQQPGSTGSYPFVSTAYIDEQIAKELEKEGITWDDLNPDEKAEIRKGIYENTEDIYVELDARNKVLTEAKSKFAEYKADIVTKITTGKFNEIADTTALEIIDTLLVDYVTKYIKNDANDPLHTDKDVHNAIAGVIEEILFGFISDLIMGDVPTTDFDHELDGMVGHIDTIKHQFVKDADDATVAKLKKVFLDYKKEHAQLIEDIIKDKYDVLTAKFTTMLTTTGTGSIYSDVENVLISIADKVNDDLIKKYINGIIDADKKNNTTKLKDLIKQYIPKITVKDLNDYIASFLYNPTTQVENTANVGYVRTEIEAFIGDSQQASTVKDMAITYIKDKNNKTDVENYIKTFIENDIDEKFVKDNRDFIVGALKGMDLSKFVNETMIKKYINGLDEDKGEKTAFADKIFATLQSNADYTKFMHQLLNAEIVEVNKSNVSLVTAISGAIRGLSFDSVIAYVDNATINKLNDTLGTDFIKTQYDVMLAEYCDGLDAVIGEVNASSDKNIEKSYTTSLKYNLNIFDIYEKLYDKAKDEVVEKLEGANLYYNENEYLKFLVEHNILSYLVSGDKSLANGDFTGYSLKGVMDYYDYMMMLLIVGDDALTWYGDEKEGLSPKQLEDLYSVAFDKIFIVHGKVNEILEAFEEGGKLPSKIQGAVESIDKLNSLILEYGDKGKALITKYLDSNINIKFEDESAENDERVLKLVDVLVGNDDPVVSIDSVYALLASFSERVQLKLKAVVETDKFKQAVAKFESTSFGELFDGKGKLGTIEDKLSELDKNGTIESSLDSIYDMFYILAYRGIDAFKVPAEKLQPTDIDIYEFNIGKVKMTIQRSYR